MDSSLWRIVRIPFAASDEVRPSTDLLRPDGHVCSHWTQPNTSVIDAALAKATCRPAPLITMTYDAQTQDRFYERVSNAIAEAGSKRESLFLACLALLLFEQVGDGNTPPTPT